MKLEQTSYSVDNIIQLKESVNEYLRQRSSEDKTTTTNEDEKIQGGILSDIRYSWLAKGPKLEVLHTKSGAKVAAWCFRAQHDFDTGITCVVDLGNAQGKAPLLVVGLECEITGGMICVFDVGSSRVVRAVQIDDKVTSIEVVSGGFDSSLPGVLRALDGVIAVGTAKGKLLLVDLCRQICEEALANNGNEMIRDECNSCHLIHLEYDDLRNLESHKEKSLSKGDHLCLQLNENSTIDVHFTLFGPAGEIRLRANMSEVIVSSLHFSSALGSLLVGYNFGAWQLYNLLASGGPVLDYTSPMYEDCIPVGHFAVQEPCDDPRAFCYVWAAYSVQEPGDAGTTIAVMYALTYQTKELLEGYGMLYQDLQACSVRFQMELSKVVPTWSKHTGARCLTLRSYTRPLTTDSPDERLALCTLVWSCWDNASPSAPPHTYLALFDLNQWYKEQMPAQPRATLEHNERYMACVSLTDLMGQCGALKCGHEVLDIRVDPTTISPFMCPSRLEEHYYPSALAFRGLVLSPQQLGWVRSSGTQRHLLAQLELAGPLCLLQPTDLYHRCMALGLYPAHVEMTRAGDTVSQQRRVVLSVALEHQLVRWLCRCAREWANGSHASGGCTLDLVLEWAWQRANALKFSADKLCVPLFDYTGERLDHNALLQLNHAACQLKHLTTLFDTVVHYCDQYFSQQDLDDIRYQWNSLQMISIYLEVLQWLLNVGLLPECPLYMYPRPDESERMSAPYPVESLTRYYSDRRVELRGNDKTQEPQESLLFIDQLVERECGGSTLSKQWQCDGGTGLYPPPSLQALLRTYLVEDIGIEHKHCLFIYVFLDLAMTLDQSRYKSIITHLIKFPAVFKLSPSVIKMTQAFWQLDHGDFSTAMAQLLDPAVASEDLKPWHHRTVLKSLLLQGQHQHALLYQQVRKPPVSSVHDISIVITLLIVNDLLQEAFHFQRQNRSVYNENEILKHFFTVSDKMNHLSSILQLPLSSSEEDAFISYLRSHSSETNQNLLVIYYLQRDRYDEAFRTNDALNSNSGSDLSDAIKQGLLGQQEKNFRNVIVSGFKKTLPDVTQTLLEYMKNKKVNEEGIWVEVDHVLKPMSVFIHDAYKEATYKSTLIHASFQKAKETWSKYIKDKDNPFISTPKIVADNDKRNETPLIYASVMQPHSSFDSDPDTDASPAKRMRLSPRQPISGNMCAPLQRISRLSTNSSTTVRGTIAAVQSPSLSLLDTPIVKRKSYRDQTQREDGWSPVPSVIGTPTSILKVRSFIRKSQSPDVADVRGTSTTPEILDVDMEGDELESELDSGIMPLDQSTAIAIQSVGINMAKKISSNVSVTKERHRSPLGVSPRRPIQRTPRPAVHFEDFVRPNSRSSSASDTSTGTIPTKITTSKQHLEVQIDVHREQTPDQDHSSKDSSKSTEDVFYSPNETFEESAGSSRTMEVDKQISDNSETRRASLKRKANDSSVKSRRSYKTNTPIKVEAARNIRESLRSKDSLNKSETQSVKSGESTLKLVESYPVIVVAVASNPEESTPKVYPKIGGRRSISPSPKSDKDENGSKDDVFLKFSGRRLLEPSLQTAVTAKPDESLRKDVFPKISGRRSVEPIPVINKPVESSPKLDGRRLVELSPKTTVESCPKKEVFPKLGGRRSLTRQVLEQNVLARAMQTRLSMAKIPENSQTVGVEVSYSKTVTSFVNETSDTGTEEKCDKSKIELKNVFTTEKDSESVAQIIKHVHNESSSKSSLKKVTEILNESDQEENQQSHDSVASSHVLTLSSDIDDSIIQSSYQPSERKETNMSTTSSREDKQNIEKDESKCDTSETAADVSVENISKLLETIKNKRGNLSETVFEDISSIVEESEESESDEDNMETSEYVPTRIFQSDETTDKHEKQVKINEGQSETMEYVPTKIFQAGDKEITKDEYVPTKILQSDDKELSKNEYIPTKISQTDEKQVTISEEKDELNLDDESKDSSEDKISNQSEESNDNVVIEAEIHEPASRDESAASSDAENDESDRSLEEQQENYLVPSSEEDSDEEEKISNQEEEQECEEIEEHENSEEDNSSRREESEISSIDNSSRSSDVIEIKSSSEESMEELRLNNSDEAADIEHEESENEENENEEGEHEECEHNANSHEDNVHEANVSKESEDEQSEHEENENIMEQNIETMEEIIEEIPIEVNVEIHEEDRELQIEEDILETEEVVEEMEQMEKEFEIEDIQEIEQDAAEEIVEVAEIQQEITQEEEGSNEIPEDIQLEIEECAKEQEKSVEEEMNQEEISEAKGINQTEEINQAVILETTVANIIDKDREEKEKSQSNVSQDWLETISFCQPNEEMHKTDILCDEKLTNKDQIQKVEMENIPVEEENYTPNRRSKRISSKQENKKIEEEIVPQKPTRKRSMSVDVEEKTASSEELSKFASRRKRSTSVDVETISKIVEESSKPARSSNRSVDVESKLAEEESPKPVKPSTRRRSTTVDVETTSKVEESSKPVRSSMRRRSTSIDIKTKPVVVEKESSTPARSSTRRKSINVDVEAKPIEEKPIRSSTRRRSTSVDVESTANTAEDKPVKAIPRIRKGSTSVDTEAEATAEQESIKPAIRTRTRSTSVEIGAKPTSQDKSIKPAARTRKRSTSVDIEDTSKPQTSRRKRSTSVDIEEQETKVSTPKRSTRASSVINLPVIEEETPSRRTTRASSIESSASQRSKRGSSLEAKSPAKRGRKRSIQSDVIAEENESTSSDQVKRTALEDIPEKIEEYSATHRLTRRQKVIMEKSLELQEMKKLEAKETKPRVADFDPIKLLDKESFSGSPDLDERHNRSASPASSVDTQSSVATHLTPESITPNTPHRGSRRGGRRSSQSTTPIVTPGTPRRTTRTMSRDTPADDAVSDVSSVRSVPMMSIPIVKLDRMDMERHRSLSPTVLSKESVSSTAKGRRKSVRSSILPQADLSKISEENSIESDHVSPKASAEVDKGTRPTRGRPKKDKTVPSPQESHSSQSAESQESKTGSQRRTMTYKPLEEYVRYSVHKTRKTFKVKKLTRKSTQQ